MESLHGGSKLNNCFLVTKSISSFFFFFDVSRNFLKMEMSFHYTLETKVIKGCLTQYFDLFILKLNILFLYCFEYL